MIFVEMFSQLSQTKLPFILLWSCTWARQQYNCLITWFEVEEMELEVYNIDYDAILFQIQAC